MNYEDLTLKELKEILKERNLKVSGKKAELVQRLQESDKEITKSTEEESIQDEENTEEESIQDEENIDEDYSEDEYDDDYDDGEFEEWDDFHTSKQKPILDDATIDALSVRKIQSKKQPKFRRQEWFRYRRLSKTGYRKPKGNDSKMRKNRKYRSPMARVGYGKIASARGLHPSGFEEILVHNEFELDGLDPERQAVRIGSKVGNRKRFRIHDRADNLGLRILNRRRMERKGDLQ
tara:strand:+ start:819 stop:1523 length:705 start_codon:yes stop_codon:yes gene_type:complete